LWKKEEEKRKIGQKKEKIKLKNEGREKHRKLNFQTMQTNIF
jgi:hypothetical protein